MLSLATRPAPGLGCPAARPARPGPRRRATAPRHHSLQPCALGASGSFDGDEKVDLSLTRELESVAGRQRYEKLATHLELLYQASQPQSEVGRITQRRLAVPSVAASLGCRRLRRRRQAPPPAGTAALVCSSPLSPQRNKVELCQSCRGSKERECEWCHGTGKPPAAVCALSGCSPVASQPHGLTAPTPCCLAVARCHDHRRDAVLQRGRLHALPRLPRLGEWRRAARRGRQGFRHSPTTPFHAYYHWASCVACSPCACRARARVKTAAAPAGARRGCRARRQPCPPP